MYLQNDSSLNRSYSFSKLVTGYSAIFPSVKRQWPLVQEIKTIKIQSNDLDMMGAPVLDEMLHS